MLRVSETQSLNRKSPSVPVAPELARAILALRKWTRLFEVHEGLERIEAHFDRVPVSGRPAPERSPSEWPPAETPGLRSLRMRLFLVPKAGRDFEPQQELALEMAAQAAWIEAGLLERPLHSEKMGPACALTLSWPSAWPLEDDEANALAGVENAFRDKMISWFFPAHGRGAQGFSPYRLALFEHRAKEMWALCEQDAHHHQRMEAQRESMPALNAVSFEAALALAKRESPVSGQAAGSSLQTPHAGPRRREQW